MRRVLRRCVFFITQGGIAPCKPTPGTPCTEAQWEEGFISALYYMAQTILLIGYGDLDRTGGVLDTVDEYVNCLSRVPSTETQVFGVSFSDDRQFPCFV